MGSTPRIGLIGLGNAGQAMLRPLSLRYPMAIHDRDPARCDQSLAACKAPPTVSPSAAALAESAELVILSLPNPAASCWRFKTRPSSSQWPTTTRPALP